MLRELNDFEIDAVGGGGQKGCSPAPTPTSSKTNYFLSGIGVGANVLSGNSVAVNALTYKGGAKSGNASAAGGVGSAGNSGLIFIGSA